MEARSDWGATYPERFHRDYGRFVTHSLEDGSTLLAESAEVSEGLTAFHHWLLFPTDVPVAFCRVLYYANRDLHRLILCEIEVREAYRGAGLAREFADAIQNFHNDETLWTTGAFTPEGATALRFLPTAPSPMGPVTFNSMNFVVDWNNLVEKYPL